ncbi:2-oxoglutarate dehydrogenase E1 subunit family protein, partial [Microbacterium sp.]|uniref:2-oxoglutarate dehydrogenase E1 subunit family protein n=1 Tax=Microbacterium sp. TaxID=51671 RepID=UPI003A838E48
MSSPVTGVGTSSEGEFGANEWLVAELYEQFREDKNSVDQSWWPILEAYHPNGDGDTATTPVAPAPPAAPAQAAPPATPQATSRPVTAPTATPVARTTAKPAARQPIPAQAPSAAPVTAQEAGEDVITPLRGMPKTLAANMDESLTVPTATSVRTVPAKLM